MSKYRILTSFHLKIIAMALMLIDHIGAFDFFIPHSSPWYLVLRIIGRCAFPLFAFFLCEGMRYSKKPLIYLGRIFLLGLLVDISLFVFFDSYNYSCVLMTFFLSGLCIYCLEQEKVLPKILSAIPFSIVILSGFSFFPLHLEYGFYGIATVLLFYLSEKISQKISMDEETFLRNYTVLSFALFVVFNAACGFFSFELRQFFDAGDVDFKLQTYGIIGAVLLLFYNGKKGYRHRTFQWACYLFYPLHIAALYLIMQIAMNFSS